MSYRPLLLPSRRPPKLPPPPLLRIEMMSPLHISLHLVSNLFFTFCLCGRSPLGAFRGCGVPNLSAYPLSLPPKLEPSERLHRPAEITQPSHLSTKPVDQLLDHATTTERRDALNHPRHDLRELSAYTSGRPQTTQSLLNGVTREQPSRQTCQLARNYV